MNEDLLWAWFAGIFEGEGSISDRGKTSVVLQVAMTDKDIIDRIRGLCGGTVAERTKYQDHHKVSWMWYVSSKAEVEWILRKIMPYMGDRRKDRAKRALERLSTNRGSRSKTHCRNGHVRSPENTYVRKDGVSKCKICMLEANRKSRGRSSA